MKGRRAGGGDRSNKIPKGVSGQRWGKGRGNCEERGVGWLVGECTHKK